MPFLSKPVKRIAKPKRPKAKRRAKKLPAHAALVGAVTPQLYRSRATVKQKVPGADVRPMRDDAAVIYAFERLEDVERKLLAVLKDYERLCELTGQAMADAVEAKRIALHEQSMRIRLQGELNAFAAVIGARLGLEQVPDFSIEKILDSKRRR